MTKRPEKEFNQSLQKLFDDRTHWLWAQVREPSPGAAPIFNKKKVERSIKHLQALATNCLLRRHEIAGLKELYDLKKQWHVKGWGVDQKKENFLAWFDRAIPFRNLVYVFWAKRKCRYVGRTFKGRGRLKGHFNKIMFLGVTRVDVYAARGKKNIPKLECLATHRFQPTDAKNKPSARKFYKKCPIHEAHRAIRSEVKSIFRLK